MPSFGVHCAALAGMSTAIIERTKEVGRWLPSV